MSGIDVDEAIPASREEENYCSIGRKKLFQRFFIYCKKGLPVHFYIINENEDTWKVYDRHLGVNRRFDKIIINNDEE